MISFQIGELLYFKPRCVMWIGIAPYSSKTRGTFIRENKCYAAICLSSYRHQPFAIYYFYIEGKLYQLFDDQVRCLIKVPHHD